MPVFLLIAALVLQNSPTKQTAATKGPVAVAPYQRGSDTLPVVVKMTNTGKSQAESDQDRIAAKWALRFTLATTAFTLGLLIVAALQWRTTDRQRVIMEKQQQTMESQ